MRWMGTKPSKNGSWALAVFFAQRQKSQSDSRAAFHVANNGIGSDTSLLHEKIELGRHSFLNFRMRGPDKEAVDADVQDTGDILTPIATPADPDVLRCWKPV